MFWNTKKDGTGKEYADKGKVTLPQKQDLDLYAQWEPSKLTVSPIDDQTWTGQAITPTVTVKDGDDTLKLDTDYTVTYKDNTNAGTATVTVTGKGDYKDATSVTVPFKIVKADSVPATVTAKELTYSGTDQALVTVDDSTLVGGTMEYALGVDGETAPTADWSEAVPTATDAGIYYV